LVIAPKDRNSVRTSDGQRRSGKFNQPSPVNSFLQVGRPMRATEWNTYRTRFLVRARQLSSNLSFTDTLGRQHSGRKGDYLVESSDGVLRIAPRQIFEDIYVPMALDEAKLIPPDEPMRLSRKVPPPCGDRRPVSNRMGFMWS
jgi:hypothetical protein